MHHYAALLLLTVYPAFAQTADLAGTWELTLARFGDPEYRRVTFESKDGKYTGKFRGRTFEATVRGAGVEIACLNPDEAKEKSCGHLSGKMEGGVWRGSGEIYETPTTWELRRAKERPAEAPKVHTFEPTQFHRHFADNIPPVLTLYPGDTVKTWSVDAGGRDPKNKQRSLGGNPLTGPFYVEGALPGDTLVVKLLKVRLNRDSAGSGDMVVGSLLDPYFFHEQKDVKNFDSEWKLDLAAQTGMLAKPTDRLKKFKVPLRPMLGCIGVAPPAHNALRSGHLGDFGGNMDYNQLQEGVTVYLPVYQRGALLFVGDGHAAQGDGELTGDALETSMDIEFSVDLRKDKSLGTPWFENAEYVMVSGIGNSLLEAVQGATSGLSQYLEQEFKLNAAEIGIVLGTSIKYDIAEMVDPKVHVVAKVRKEALEQLR